MESSEAPPQSEGPGSAYSAEFYLYSFKIVPCSASYAHNWSLCPFVHPNEKARRRDPRLYLYEPLPCPFDKKGANCPHGDACIYTHNVYEWGCHPARFRTQMCQQGAQCKRPLCFFAHNLQELRFVEGTAAPRGTPQVQQGALPAPQAAGTALGAAAAAAAAGGVGPSLLPAAAEHAAAGLAGAWAQQQQQQQVAAVVAPQAGAAYVPALVPCALLPPAAGAHSPAQLQYLPGGVMAGGAGQAQGRALGAAGTVAAAGRMPVPQQQQQQQWLQGYYMPQGYVVLGDAQGQVMYANQDTLANLQFQQQQQQQQAQQPQQVLPLHGGQWQLSGAAAGLASGSNMAMPRGMPEPSRGLGGLQLDPARVGPQFQVVPDDQVLLGQAAGNVVLDSSSSFISLQQQQQQQQQQQELAAAAASASGVSWAINQVNPSTTTASASMSLLSVPTAGLNSAASVPGSSSSNLSHLRPGQAGGTVSLDVLQATMQQLSVRDPHVRDL